MKAYVLTIIKTDWQDGDVSHIEYAGATKQICMNKAFEDLSEKKIKQVIKEYDEDFKLTEDNFLEMLTEYSPYSQPGFDDFEWLE